MNQQGGAHPLRLGGPEGLFASALILAGAATVVLVAWEFGLGTSNDGVLYLSAAEHLREGSGLTDFRGDPLIIFPPLFPVLISALDLVVPNVETAALVLQTLLYIGNLALAGLLIARVVQSRVWFLTGILLLVVSRTFLLYHYYVLSEPLFVFLTLGLVYTLCKWKETGRRSLLIGAATLAALSCLTRYVGMANVLAGAVVLISTDRNLKRRVNDILLFGTLSVVPLIAWLVRNAVITDSLTGDRLPSPYPLLFNLQLVADSLALWFIPDEVPPWLRIVFVITAAVLVGGALRKMARTPTAQSSSPSNQPRTSDRTVLWVTALSHVVVLTAATSVFASDYVSTRFVMPVYVPVLILTVAVLAWSFEHIPTTRPAVATVLFVWMAVQFATTVRLVADRFEHGVGGYATSSWEESQVMEFVRDHPDSLGTDAFSNAALAVYFHTGVVVDFLPDRLNPRWSATYPVEGLPDRPSMEDLRSLLALPDRDVTLIWFDIATRDPRFESLYLFKQYDLEEIRSIVHTVPIHEAADGSVYRLRPGEAVP